MKLKKQFADFYKEIRIDDETHALRDKREVLQADIKAKLPGILEDHDITINKSDIRLIDQGSYKYHTTIKADVVDRDVAVMIPLSTSDNTDTRKIKGYLRDAIDIPARTVVIKEPCVRASYYEDGKEWLHIDLPLYAEDGDSVEGTTVGRCPHILLYESFRRRLGSVSNVIDYSLVLSFFYNCSSIKSAYRHHYYLFFWALEYVGP